MEESGSVVSDSYIVMVDTLYEVDTGCTCGVGKIGTVHEPGCGLIPVFNLTSTDLSFSNMVQILRHAVAKRDEENDTSARSRLNVHVNEIVMSIAALSMNMSGDLYEDDSDAPASDGDDNPF